MDKLQLKIVTPQGLVFDDTVDQVNVETERGEIGILPHHEGLTAQIVPGEMRVKQGGKTTVMATGGGLLQVAGGQLSILTDSALEADLLDEGVILAAKQRAQEALEQKLSDEEYAVALGELEKSLAKLKVKRRHRSAV